MFKEIIILILIPAAFVCSLDSDDKYVTDENDVFTEQYQASYQAVSMFESDSDKKQEFMPVAAEQSGHLPYETDFPTFEDAETETDVASILSMMQSSSTPSPSRSSSSEDDLQKADPSTSSSKSNSELELEEGNSTGPNVLSSEVELEQAKADIKAWAENLDCETSPLGPMRCPLVKKLVDHFFRHINGDVSRLSSTELRKLSVRVKAFIHRLEKNGVEVDPEVKILIQKHKKLLDLQF